jgi:hypothetical protein
MSNSAPTLINTIVSTDALQTELCQQGELQQLDSHVVLQLDWVLLKPSKGTEELNK